MKHSALLIVFFCSFVGYSQTENVNLSDKALQNKLYKELTIMQKNGASADTIFEKFMIETDRYILSREAYYRLVVFTRNISELMIDKKMKEGNLKDSDLEMADGINKKMQNYSAYLENKKTEKAKETWENNVSDGILKLVVADINKLDEEEQKRYDDTLALLNRDDYFKSFVITDGIEYKTILKTLKD